MTGLPKALQTYSDQSLPSLLEPSSTPEVEATIPLSIVSNSVLLREGLLLLLKPYIDARFVGSYPGSGIKNDPCRPNPAGHIALVDSNLGREIALEWIGYWKNLLVPALVIVLEITHDPELILNYIEVGASGYTMQGATPAEVADTIRAIRLGKAHCSPEMTAFLFARLAAKPTSPLPRPNGLLTAREQEVLRYIEANYSNQQIAEALVIETLTVKHHVHNILAKLKVAHRHEAARIAREQGWISQS